MEKIIIAIDGPAGAGKSTVAKALANELDCLYIDTGAMYRSVGVFAMEHGVEVTNANEVEKILDDIHMEVTLKEDGQHIIINGEDVNGKIRTPKASMAASSVAVIPKVREKLVEIQRKTANKRSVVMDGRDIGTYVLPDADIKLFLTASVQERAQRRHKELSEKGEKCSLTQVVSDIEKRDKQDSEREIAPLKMAKDCILVDTTGLNAEQSVEKIMEIIKERKVK